MAHRALNDDGLAQEAVQETFLRAWRAADRYDPKRSSLRTWMFAIARNVTIDLARARSVRPERTGQEVEHTQEAKDTTVGDGGGAAAHRSTPPSRDSGDLLS
jgi:RNA polymerase sigma factor (sigma-70 family)